MCRKYARLGSCYSDCSSWGWPRTEEEKMRMRAERVASRCSGLRPGGMANARLQERTASRGSLGRGRRRRSLAVVLRGLDRSQLYRCNLANTGARPLSPGKVLRVLVT